MKLLALIFSVHLAPFCAECFRSDYTYLEATGSFYKIDNNEKTWWGGKRHCEADGATLYFPEDENEAIAVIELWNETHTVTDHFFIGISDLKTKGSYETVDERPMADVYWRWGNGEPNDVDGQERCLVMRRDLTYNDDRCGREYAHVCKIPGVTKHVAGEVHGSKFCKMDYTYLESTEAYYKVYTEHRTWWAAKRYCEKEGASLFYAEDDNEATAVIQLWNQTTTHDHFYVGISDLKMKGYFETIDGQPLSDVHHVWGEGEPNDITGKEDCLVLRRDRTLNDDSCAWEYPYICKKFKETVKWNCECKMNDTDYVYKGDLDRCYKFHNEPKNWTEAVASCAAENSYLAIINSDEEANYFKALIEKHKNENVTTASIGMNGVVYLGFYEDDDGWKTVDGDPLNYTGYNEWSEKTLGPKPSVIKEQYGSMVYDGKLSERNGLEKLFYICEHEIRDASNEGNGMEDSSTYPTSDVYDTTTETDVSSTNEIYTVPNEFHRHELTEGEFTYHNIYSDYYTPSSSPDYSYMSSTPVTNNETSESIYYETTPRNDSYEMYERAYYETTPTNGNHTRDYGIYEIENTSEGTNLSDPINNETYETIYYETTPSSSESSSNNEIENSSSTIENTPVFSGDTNKWLFDPAPLETIINEVEYATPSEDNYRNKVEFTTPSEENYSNKVEYTTPSEENYSNKVEYTTPSEENYSNKVEYTTSSEENYSNKVKYTTPSEENYSNKVEYTTPSEENYSNRVIYTAPSEEYYSNRKEYTAPSEETTSNKISNTNEMSNTTSTDEQVIRKIETQAKENDLGIDSHSKVYDVTGSTDNYDIIRPVLNDVTEASTPVVDLSSPLPLVALRNRQQARAYPGLEVSEYPY